MRARRFEATQANRRGSPWARFGVAGVVGITTLLMLLLVAAAGSADPTPSGPSPAALGLTQTVPPSVSAGSPITATAVLTDAPSDGTIVFSEFGPEVGPDQTCSSETALSSPSVPVTSGTGSYSTSFVPKTVGDYGFMAVYTGASPSDTASSECGVVHVTQATPSLQTTASPSVAVGGTITDTASLTGSADPSTDAAGITFAVYGPSQPSCTGTPVTLPAAAGTSATSVAYTPPIPGTYNWIATYPGDANNAGVTGGCGDPGESVTVTPATPTLTTSASPSVALGGTVSDAAVLQAGYNPTGTITFNLYGPSDPTCTGTPVFTSSNVPLASTTASGPYTPTAAGTYRFVATYNGDPANNIVGGVCADPTESVVVGASVPPPSTTPQLLPLPTGKTSTKCVPQAMASALAKSIVAALTGKPGSAFKATCGGSVRIVLRSKELRPGNPGYPRHDGYTTISDTLTHSTRAGQIAFAINPQGVALRKYAEAEKKSMLVFAIVHVRPTSGVRSSEAIRIFSLT